MIENYEDRQARVRLPYDNIRQLYLEYETFNGAQQNEETFVPYLNFPVGKNFTFQEKKIMTDTYDKV